MNHFPNRLICYLDVLGYSHMVREYGIEHMYKKYANFVDLAKSKVFFSRPENYDGPIDNFEVAEIVSDSVLLVSHDIRNITSVNNFIGSIHFFLEIALSSGFMFRGCVSQGDVIFDKERNIVLSDEFNEMADFEKKIDAPVCTIFKRASGTIIEAMFGDSQRASEVELSKSLPVIRWNTPIKDQEKESFWCINYTYFCGPDLLEEVVSSLSGDQRKQENFIEYLNYLEALPEEVVRPSGGRENSEVVKIMKSRTGMRVAFFSSEGYVIQTSNDMRFPAEFIEPPEQISISVDPETKGLSFTAKGRWY